MNANFQIPRELTQRAARVGPGYRGRREQASEDELRALQTAFRDAGADPPAFLDQDVKWVERRAKLFEAGDFPDKGVTITPAMLKALEKNFDLPVPILIEHAASPLELGYLIEVEALKDELFGTIALTPEADALVERSGAKSLSLGLTAELSEIREVSLVRNPRVPDAKLFFAGSLEGTAEWQTRFEELEARVRCEAAERTAEALVREGRLSPAQLPFAVALLQSEDTVAFGRERKPVSRLFALFVEARPPGALFGELAPATLSDPSTMLMLPEEADFYKRYFPDVSLDQIAAKRA